MKIGQTSTSIMPKTLTFDVTPLTCNAVTKKFCACQALNTIGMSSSSTNGSPADCPRSSNNSPPATRTGICQIPIQKNHNFLAEYYYLHFIILKK